MHVCVRERVCRLAGGEVVEGRVGWRLAGGKNPVRLSMILKNVPARWWTRPPPKAGDQPPSPAGGGTLTAARDGDE